MPQELNVGDVLRTSFEVIQKNLATFLLLVSIIAVPNLLLAIGSGVVTRSLMPAPGVIPDARGMLDTFLPLLPVYLVGMIVLLITYTIAQAGMTFTAVEHMAGRTAGAGSALMAASRSVVALIVGSFLVGLATFFGTLLCFVPGIIAALFFCLTTPAILVERLGPIAGMERSIQLTEGHKLNIFLVFLALFGIAIVVSMCIVGPATGALVISSATPGVMPDPLSPGQIVVHIISTVINGFISAFGTTTIAVIYARIRGIRDGMDAEAFAAVFA